MHARMLLRPMAASYFVPSVDEAAWIPHAIRSEEMTGSHPPTPCGVPTLEITCGMLVPRNWSQPKAFAQVAFMMFSPIEC
jgi:hypothetical protein